MYPVQYPFDIEIIPDTPQIRSSQYDTPWGRNFKYWNEYQTWSDRFITKPCYIYCIKYWHVQFRCWCATCSVLLWPYVGSKGMLLLSFMPRRLIFHPLNVTKWNKWLIHFPYDAHAYPISHAMGWGINIDIPLRTEAEMPLGVVRRN